MHKPSGSEYNPRWRCDGSLYNQFEISSQSAFDQQAKIVDDPVAAAYNWFDRAEFHPKQHNQSSFSVQGDANPLAAVPQLSLVAGDIHFGREGGPERKK